MCESIDNYIKEVSCSVCVCTRGLYVCYVIYIYILSGVDVGCIGVYILYECYVVMWMIFVFHWGMLFVVHLMLEDK